MSKIPLRKSLVLSAYLAHIPHSDMSLRALDAIKKRDIDMRSKPRGRGGETW